MSTNRELIRAVIQGDSTKAQQLDSQLTLEQRSDFNTYATVFFGCILPERFPQADRGDIARFVDQMEHAYRTIDPPIKRLELEGLLRGFLMDEEELFDEIDPQTQIRLQLLSIRAIADQVDKVRDRLEDFLTDAETLKAEITN